MTDPAFTVRVPAKINLHLGLGDLLVRQSVLLGVLRGHLILICDHLPGSESAADLLIIV